MKNRISAEQARELSGANTLDHKAILDRFYNSINSTVNSKNPKDSVSVSFPCFKLKHNAILGAVLELVKDGFSVSSKISDSYYRTTISWGSNGKPELKSICFSVD